MSAKPNFSDKEQKEADLIIEKVSNALTALFENASKTKGYTLDYIQTSSNSEDKVLIAIPKSKRQFPTYGFNTSNKLTEAFSTFSSPRIKSASLYITKQAMAKTAETLGLTEPNKPDMSV